MAFCTKCGTVIDPKTMKFCPKCGLAIPSIDITGTKVEATNVEPSNISPTNIQPTAITPTLIEPTNIESTDIKPTTIKSTDIKPFSIQSLLLNAFGSIVGFIALPLAFIYIEGMTSWLAAFLFLMMGILGIIGIYKQILKLPINQSLVDKFNSKLQSGKTPVNQSTLPITHKIWYRLVTANSKTKIITFGALGAIGLTFIISLTSALSGGVAKPTTPITGVWVHELGTGHTDTTWVVNITMWSVTESDPGEVYMNVSDDNTFTVTYNAAMVSYGTWEETANNNYEFWYHDPDEILMALSVDYQISGNNLVQGLGPNSIYCTKQ